MATFNFNYRPSNIFKDLQPAGLSIYGEQGVKGESGSNGTTVYFANYQSLDSYEKDTIISKIKEGKKLNSDEYLVNQYNNGDLIICTVPNGLLNNIYKIVIENDNYDVVFVGTIRRQQKKDNLYSRITGLYLNIINENDIKVCHTPVNRSFELNSSINDNVYFYNCFTDTSTYNYPRVSYDKNGVNDQWELNEEISSDLSVTYDKAMRYLFGITFSPYIQLDNSDVANNYDFYLKIKLENNKTFLPQSNYTLIEGISNNFSSNNLIEDPIGNAPVITTFDKVIEIPLNKKIGTGTINKEYNDWFVSDMSADKLHPSKNSINTTFFNPYESLFNISQNQGLQSIFLKTIQYGKPKFNRKNIKSPIYYWRSIYSNYRQDPDQDASINMAAKNSTYDYEFIDLLEKPYTETHTYLQYTKLPATEDVNNVKINYMGGESAYFSRIVFDSIQTEDSSYFPLTGVDKKIGCTKDCTYDQYVLSQRSLNYFCNDFNDNNSDRKDHTHNRIDKVKSETNKELKNFLFNANNEYELICVDTNNGEVKILYKTPTDL